MTYVITIAQRKGGAGKTTLASQLAAAFAAKGISVLGVDLDEQQSFTSWGNRRRERFENDETLGDDVFFLGVTDRRMGLASGLRRASAVDVVIIDTPPTADFEVRRAIKAANLVVAPLQLSPIDLSASLPTAQAIGEAKKSALFVINRVLPKARVATEIRKKIEEFNLPVARAELGNRTAFTESMMTGAGVVETAPRSAAAKEINALMSEIFDIAGQLKQAA